LLRSLTYAEMAGALKITPESANRLARRKRWPRVKGNDGRTRVAVPEEALVRQDSPPDNPPASPMVNLPDSPMDSPPDKALEAHIETLKAQLAEEKARAEKQADDLVAYDTAYAAGLAAERAKAERLIAEFAARDAQHVADLAAERATTERAIAAFTSLADRLDALAAERAKPW
jgi:flagellar biosynthesis/type III secretory pathway protein FliH